MKRTFLFFAILHGILFSQQSSDTIFLDEMVINDIRLKYNSTQFIQNLSDSIIQENPTNLTEILNFNTPIYFKENGYGMVSSPSFRGTTASQTAVLWNGIKINSGFLGQTDFNTISTSLFDNINIKPGGGSVTHGSGAIGGSVHLNHHLRFNQGWENQILARYGSFNTINLAVKSKFSNQENALSVGFQRNSSDNDYVVEELDYQNLNGQFYNQTLNINAAHQFNQKNEVSIFLEGYEGERHFSLIEPTSNKTKYQNRNIRSLIQWENRLNLINNNLKIGWLNEDWKYFQNIEKTDFSGGNLSTFFTKYDGVFHINSSVNLNLFGEFFLENANGKGNGISHITRKSGNTGIMLNHKILNDLTYEMGIRKEWNATFKSPLLFSFGIDWNASQYYNLKGSVSKNFRAPTFNDLYWEPGGNLDLKAENSLQFEMNHIFKFYQNSIALNLYHYKIQDMIRWLPTANGFWSPMNEDEVKSKGFEIITQFNHSFKKNSVKLTSSYAFTHAENYETGKQLFYVPKHKLNGTITYDINPLSLYLQGLYVGEIFTTADENPYFTLDDYQVFNAGFDYQFYKYFPLKIGFNVKNLLNKIYEAYPYRIMPKRNYNIELQINF